MRLTGLFGVAVCVLCGCQPSFAAKALRGLRERAAGAAADYALEWKPEEWTSRDEWGRWDKDVHSYRWSLADRDIEEVSSWFMEQLWWYLFGTGDVQVKTWWKLRRSFRNYLREWWLTTPWAGVGTLKTGVWYALSKLTFEELPAWWGGTQEYEKVKELLQDDVAIDRWTENIQRRLICAKRRDPSRWWKPGPWDNAPEEGRWDWEDLEKMIWRRGDNWWDTKEDRRIGPWDKPEDRWDWEGWDKERHRKRGRWDTKRDDGRWDWEDIEKSIWRGGDDWWDTKENRRLGPWDRPEDRWEWEGRDKERYRKRGQWDSKRDGGLWDWGGREKKTQRWADDAWDWRNWKDLEPLDRIRDDGRSDLREPKRRRGADEGWDNRYWKKLFKDVRKRGRSGWTGKGPWDSPFLDLQGGGWSWDGQWEGGGGDWKSLRRTGWDEEAKRGWKPWRKEGKEADDKWEPKFGRVGRKGARWDRSGWKGMDALGLADTASYSADEDDERGWKERWEGDERGGRKSWKK